MSYIHDKKKKLKNGKIAHYYEEVESYWEDGKSKQRVIKYLGKHRYQTKIELNPKLAGKVARILADNKMLPETRKEELDNLGIPVPQGKFKEAKMIFNPPSGKPTLIIYCE